MSKFYCNVCEEDIILQDGKCPKCKTDWNKIINEDLKSEELKPINPISKKRLFVEDNFEQEKENEDVKEITEDDINSNISFFLTWGLIAKVVAMVLGAIIAVGCFILASNVNEYQHEQNHTDIIYIVLGVIIPIIMFIAGIILENNFKWKAYMLKNTCGINKKNK